MKSLGFYILDVFAEDQYAGNQLAVDIKVEQGYEMGRPSKVHLRARQKTKGPIEVQVGGKVQLAAKGELV
jgi:trans-2,3-dihydro-3-hydroxyanthranilate isomerase